MNDGVGGGDGIGWGEGGGWLIHIRMWVGDRGWVLSHSLFFFFFTSAFAFCSLMSCLMF